MRGNKLRFAGATLLAALCAILTIRGVDALAQPVPPGIAVQDPKAKDKKDDKKNDRPAGTADLAIGLPSDRDSKQQLRAARDYLAFKDVPWKTVCPLLQNILNSGSDSFFELDEKSGDRKITRLISVKTEANRIISAFPPKGLQQYQEAYGQDAIDELEKAVRNNYDLAALSDVSQRYFHTKAGGDATVMLGSIYLERGNFLEAAYAFERLLSRPESADLLTGRTLFKAAVAMKRSGDPRHTELLKEVWAKFGEATKNQGLTIGRKNYTAEELRAEVDRPVGAVASNTGVGEWAMRLGNPQRNAVVEGGTPFLEPSFRPLTMFHTGDDEGNNWVKGELERLYNRDGKARGLPIPSFFPLTTPDLIIFRSYNGVYAFATRDHTVTVRGEPKLIRAGDNRWIAKSTVGVHQLMSVGTDGLSSDIDAKNNATNWWGQYLRMDAAGLLYDNPLLGSLAHDGTNVFFVDDVAIPPPPVPQFDERFGGIRMGGQQQLPLGGELAEAVRAGKLVAVNMQTGKIAWELGRLGGEHALKSDNAPLAPPLPRLNPEEADKTTNAFQLCLDAVFLGPPLPLNGRLYTLIEQSGAIRLLCLDPKNLVNVPGRPEKAPTLVWTQNLGRPNNGVATDSIRRMQGAYLAASEGILVCPTNSGAVVGVDIMSRSLLWAHAYRKVNEKDERPRNQQFDNMGMPIPAKLPVDKWRAAAPVVANGRVVVTAYDSNLLECIDLRTGKVLWETPRQADDLYVGGVVNDRVIVVGKKEIRAYHLTGETDLRPKESWRAGIPNPTGHGVASKTTYFVPVRQDAAGKDNTPAAEIVGINIETGAVASRATARKRNELSDLAKYGLGNLVVQDGVVYAQSPWEVAAYPQLEQKRAEMDRRLKDNPRDPLGLTDRGELHLDDNKLQAAIADFKEAQKNLKPDDPLERRLREKLHDAYRELLRNDFSAGEQYLKEYEALCEVPLDTDDPDVKVRRIDETARNKRTYLYLLARGREGQGRLNEAFTHYMTLANLGEGKALIDMPDEPSVRMRPDVWARGRIESMIRGAKTGDARKELEGRVQAEWEKVKGGNDLARLREFVSVFGPYFATGTEAQFKLSDLLLETNNDADAREAQGYLSGLRADGDAPAVRARATERLARMMVKLGMVEDAVGLYLQLGKDFPDVVVRDGKTGADFTTDLLTDKRLLPYLEPSRYPMPSRVKAEARFQQLGIAAGAFEIEPAGELLPMFRRMRFVIDTTVSGNHLQWTIRAFDRSTSAERVRFPDIAAAGYDNSSRLAGGGGGIGTIPFSRGIHASGHLIVAHVGTWVYCLDLAEKKERWRINLTGDTAPVQTMNNQGTPVAEHADGDFSAKSDDGIIFTLGKSVVHQPGYVALRTAKGLEVYEPSTRREIWKRTGLGTKTLIFGDARHVLLVELDDNRKPTSTKVLRAVDGMVEDAPDLGKALAAATSYRAFGRTALLTEGTGDEKRVLRLLDLVTGKDVWRKEYDAKAVPVKALNPDWCGFALPTGEVELLTVKAGKPVAAVKLDATAGEALKAASEVLVLADADRFYVVPDKPGANAPRIYSSYALRTQRVNGPLHCFDRATGRKLWHYDGVFENQMLLLDYFGDVPVVCAAAPQLEPNSRQYVYKVVVIEKARGMLLYNNHVVYNSATFQNVAVDPRAGTVELQRYDVRIHISPDTEAKANP